MAASSERILIRRAVGSNSTCLLITWAAGSPRLFYVFINQSASKRNLLFVLWGDRLPKCLFPLLFQLRATKVIICLFFERSAAKDVILLTCVRSALPQPAIDYEFVLGLSRCYLQAISALSPGWPKRSFRMAHNWFLSFFNPSAPTVSILLGLWTVGSRRL